MELAVIVVGLAVEAVAWWVIRTGRASLWRTMPAVLVGMGVAAALVRAPVAASEVGATRALGIGLTAGFGLYLGTRAFVAIATRVEAFRRATIDIYAEAKPVPFAVAFGLSVFVMVPAEEVFYRGLLQPRLADALAPATAAVLTWLVFTLVNLPSRSLPIVLGAGVGGAVWAALGWWSGGVLASVASHILWTGLMLGLPPAPGREVVGT